jgi:hypothetical protein
MENDLNEVPTSRLYSEIGKRRVAARRKPGGRPRVLRRCLLCEVMLGTAEMRKHVVQCRREHRKP